MKNKSGISRRQFLNTTGTVVGLSALASFQPAIESVLGGRTLKIGVLLPSSAIYPQLGANFLAGIQLYLHQKMEYHNVRLITEPAGYGPASALAAARKLLDQENCDLITGVTGTEVSAGLRDLVSTHRKFLIANHLGANLVRENDQNPYVIHNTMNYWQTNWAMGRWAAEHIGRRAFISSSFYESGYDAHYAFQAGFKSKGGIIVGEYTDNLPREISRKNYHFHEITTAHPDMVFASYSGNEAARFIRNYHRAGLNANIPLLTSGITVDQSVLDQVGNAAAGIYSCIAWTGLDDNGTLFVDDYFRINRKKPDSFALLGYETAQMILTAADKVQRNMKNIAAMQHAFAETKITSPRGKRLANSLTRESESLLSIQMVKAQGAGYRNCTIAKLAADNEPEINAAGIFTNFKTGWLNPYLCA